MAGGGARDADLRGEDTSAMTPCATDAFECDRLGPGHEALRKSLANRLIYSMGKDPLTATMRDWFNTTAYAVRERLIGRWMETMRSYYRSDAKRVYYLSMEFLTGRLLSNSLLNMGPIRDDSRPRRVSRPTCNAT